MNQGNSSCLTRGAIDASKDLFPSQDIVMSWFINGRRVSASQVALQRCTGGNINHHVGRMCVDIAVVVAGVPIAVEFDSWFWHGDRELVDQRRDRMLLALGWRVLRIRSAGDIPGAPIILATLRELRSGHARVLILTMPSWGVGPTHAALVR